MVWQKHQKDEMVDLISKSIIVLCPTLNKLLGQPLPPFPPLKKKKEGDSTHLSCPMRFEFQESDLRGKGRRKEEMTDRQTLVKQSWGRVGHEHCDGEAGARQQPRTSVCLLCTAQGER